ncbi:hypothetical protein D3C86_1173530 [compost metagenome]
MKPYDTSPDTERLLQGLEWPDDLDQSTRVLARLLARQEGCSVEWTSCVELADSTPDAIEASAKVYIHDERILATVKAGGSDATSAHRNAVFFAIRQALIGERAFCGVLLDCEKARVILEPGDRLDDYWLTLELDRNPLPRSRRTGRALRHPTRVYRLPVHLDPRANNARTRYLRVRGLSQYPELREYLQPLLRVDNIPLRLHRLILALAGFDMRGERVHGHHVNEIGYDCRLENLMPLDEVEHRQRHRFWSLDLRDPTAMPALEKEGEEPRQTTLHWDQVAYIKAHSPREARHIRSDTGFKRSRPLSIGDSKRRDRKRSLDRLILQLVYRGGEASVDDLVHALLNSPCGSKSGIRNVIKVLEELGVLERCRRGKRQYVFMRVRVSRRFKIKRGIYGRTAVLRFLRLKVRLQTRSRWFKEPYSPAMLSRHLRRVYLPDTKKSIADELRG